MHTAEQPAPEQGQSATGGHTRIDDEEIRIAIAWNGGVSLAVWMGGVAVELDCARRAAFGEEDAGTRDAPAPRRIYAALSRVLERRLVPDILTGASAGGLNGALLAAVIRSGRQLPPNLLREKWLQVGDFSKLLHPTEERAPQSLMQGDLFLDEMKLMFAAVLGEAQPPPTPHVDASGYANDLAATEPPAHQVANGLASFPVLLDVMMTDVLGEPHGYADYWSNELVAREYRAPARFRNTDDFTLLALATAARASSSFPAAFEPVKLSGDVAVRAGLGAGDVRWAVDGGLLENAPVKYAIDLIPVSGGSDRAAKRFLCYLDAAPDRRAEAPPESPQPDLAAVIGYVVNLPRNARVVDQLYAVEQAVRDSGFSGEIQDHLFAFGNLDGLLGLASALFPVYRRRRTFLALDELLKSVAEARRVFESLGGDVPLPWLPGEHPFTNLAGDLAAGRWSWGFRAAQRLLLLERDLLRDEPETVATSSMLADAWKTIDAELAALADLRTSFLASDLIHQAALRLAASPTATREEFGALPDPYQPSIAASVFRATEAFIGAVESRRVAGIEEFLQRGLAIEVIRRAIAADNDFDTAEEIRFVQLTPVCPSPIFTGQPLRENGPDSPDKKLAGIRLAHFSGFYRSSWRANDFMWGRLDAAVRIVDLLLSDAHSRAASIDCDAIAGALAETLVPDDAEDDAKDRHWLAHEALVDAKSPAPPDRKIPPGILAAVTDYPSGDDPPPAAELRTFMHAALRADLSDPGRQLFTRTVCARAAQLEIVGQELGPLVAQTEVDARLGDFTAPLDLQSADDKSVRDAVVSLRKCWDKPETYLPLRLGRDSGDESVSNLALQTITHAMFVALSMARGANAALGSLLGVLRIPLLSISGVASRSFVTRAAVLASFVSAAAYVASRLVQTSKDGTASLDSLWSGWVLLSWVAAIGLLGVALVPMIRAVRSASGWRKAGQAAWAAGLAVPLLAALGFALIWGGLGAIQVVGTPQAGNGPQTAITIHAHGTVQASGTVRTSGTAPAGGTVHGSGTFDADATIHATGARQGRGTTEPPSWLVWLALGLIFVGVPALQTVKLPLLGSAQNLLFARIGKLFPIAVALAIVSLALLGWSVRALVDVLDGANWQIATAALAFASLPLCLAYLLLGTQPVRDRRLRDLR